MAKTSDKPRFPIYSALNRFEAESLEDIEITIHARSLYFALIMICMQMGGITKFSIVYNLLMSISKIGSPSTYYKTLELLEKKGFIKYTPGANRFSTAIITLLFDEYTTTKLKSYWEAIIKSTNLPVIKATVQSIKLSDVNNNVIDKKIKDYSDTIDNKDTESQGESRAESTLFEQFWAAYGKKVNEAVAREEWNKLSELEHLRIIDFVPKYVKSKPDKMYRKNPVNFLKDEVWKDEIITNTNSNEFKECKRLSVGNQCYEGESF